MISSEIRNYIISVAIRNARTFGKADVRAVTKAVFAKYPHLRPYAKSIVKIIEDIVSEVNSNFSEFLEMPVDLESERTIAEAKAGLPPLPNVNAWPQVRTRFAPNPDGPIHLGNVRAALLSYVYAKAYNGKFILRFEDTDPRTKPPLAEAYDWIREDLKWLGLKWDEEYIQSLRIEVYYQYARALLESGKAYICECRNLRELRSMGVRCEHAYKPREWQLEKWDKMLDGYYGEGEATLRIVTDMGHRNCSVRDWVAFRIIDTEKRPHPLTGSKYVVWPTYNFACAIDDHLMGISHIFRASEHIDNTIKQKFLYEHLGWRYPEAIHHGRLSLEGVVLSKSKILKGVKEGKFWGFDDPRLGTIKALRRRGILPETIWELILTSGVRVQPARISLENVHAINRKRLEPTANRYVFVSDPLTLRVIGVPFVEYKAYLPFHPNFPERGGRYFTLKAVNGVVELYVDGRDASYFSPGATLRLISAFNVEIRNVTGTIVEGVFLDDRLRHDILKVHWLPSDEVVPAELVMPDARVVKGYAEASLGSMKPDTFVQLLRWGFARVDFARIHEKVVLFFSC